MDFITRMERGRDAAAAKRHRGISTGKQAAGWNWKRSEPEAGTWAYHVAVAKCWVTNAAEMAVEDYRRAVFPERYESDPDLERIL